MDATENGGCPICWSFNVPNVIIVGAEFGLAGKSINEEELVWEWAGITTIGIFIVCIDELVPKYN